MNIKEKIKKFQSEFNPLFLKEVKKLLAEQSEFYKTDFDIQLEESVIDYCKSGKRIRPFLIYFFAEKNLDNDDIKNMTLANELFHLAALLQDDVMDESLTRRNVPTLNAVGKKLSIYNKNLGDHIGILLGDVFWTAAIEKASKLPGPIFKEFITMIQRTVRGQFLDVLGMNEIYGEATESDILARHNLKTAWYTFTSPARLGCMLNKTYSGDYLNTVTPIVRELGLLFQIRDDIIDCTDENSGKPLFSDIFEGQTTWVSLHIKKYFPDIFEQIVEARKNKNIFALKDIFENIDLHIPYKIEFAKRENLIQEISNDDADIKNKALEVLQLLTLS